MTRQLDPLKFTEGGWDITMGGKVSKSQRIHIFVDETKEETLCGHNRMDRPVITEGEKCKTCEHYLNELAGQTT